MIETPNGPGRSERVLRQVLNEGSAQSMRPVAQPEPTPAAPAPAAADDEIGERVRDLMERRKGILQQIADIEQSYDAVMLQLRDLQASL